MDLGPAALYRALTLSRGTEKSGGKTCLRMQVFKGRWLATADLPCMHERKQGGRHEAVGLEAFGLGFIGAAVPCDRRTGAGVTED